MQKKVCKMETLEEIFQDINRKYVKIKCNDRKLNNSVLEEALEILINKMKKYDNLFCSMSPRLEYLGSYYEGLRVGQPTEYDINIVFKIPVNYKNIVLDASCSEHGYTSIKMPSEFRRLFKKPTTDIKGFKDTELWCNKYHCMSVKRFRSWMQKVVDAAISTIPMKNGKHIICVSDKYYEISAKIQGPANTLSLTNNGKTIDIDLVPTLEFELPKTPIFSKVEFSKIELTKLKKYFVVPKPNGNDISWRLAFPFQERYYIKDRNNLKSALKMLKLLRDVQGFKKLASYYIKTLFLWENAKQNDEFWKHNSLSFLVLHMLRKLKDCLCVGKICNFWCPDHNLLEKVKTDTCRNWYNRLSNIIDDIEKNQQSNPHIVYKYFVDHQSICNYVPNEKRLRKN
ncbi:uncharacterized protein LOC115453020 isoform X2 [Manduca sexta]|nr:uncharacterized protein LOC115453020 isoform X2 [Manduca sexta]